MAIEKIHIRGARLESEAVRFDCPDPDPSAPGLCLFLDILKERRIPIRSLSRSASGGPCFSHLCFSEKDEEAARAAAARPELKGRVKMAGRAGILSLFPHRGRLEILGAFVSALERAGAAPLFMSSSLASLTWGFHVHEMEAAVGAVRECFDAPAIGPPEGGMETEAVYMEPRIRIYGAREARRLSLFEMGMASGPGPCLSELGEMGADFEMAFIQSLPGREPRLFVFLKERWAREARRRMEGRGAGDFSGLSESASGADLLFFHGPHFKDRHGVAQAAFDVLKKSGVRLLAGSCSESTLYAAMPGGGLEKALPAVAASFEAPK
ncbi:conserved hypothetical protein [Candidatus Desulfarcum epimagneticum]|uniref:Uncharacterized protein n=1 Tax=uncultured Desulfobacteraceae bacterium TaxID=218296 RepID=A0A484HM67_9BACT|nr:conserved hypothetical protein [uncultured Desulfobacteraceae bacterium]